MEEVDGIIDERDKEMAELRNRLRYFIEQNGRLEEQVKEGAEHRRQLGEERDWARREADLLKGELERSQREADLQTDKVTKLVFVLEKERNGGEDDDESEERDERMFRDIQSLTRRNRQLDREIGDLREETSKKEEELKLQCEGIVGQMQTAMEELQTKKRMEKKEMMEEVKSLKETVGALEIENREKTEEIMKLNKNVEDANKKYNNLLQLALKYKKERANEAIVHMNVKKELADVIEERERLTKDLDQATHKKNLLRALALKYKAELDTSKTSSGSSGDVAKKRKATDCESPSPSNRPPSPKKFAIYED